MYHTILFDLDGTLTDSREGILKSLRYAFAALGDPVPPEETLLKFIGPPFEIAFPQYCGYDAERTRLATLYFRERYVPIGKFENAAAPGMVDLCRRLAGRGYVLAVASSKPEATCAPICQRFGFAPWLREIVGSPPDADWNKAQVIQEALGRLGVEDRNAVLMVGDRKYDVEGARACGVACVGTEFFGYGEPGELEAAGAAAVVRSAEELEQFILRGGIDGGT